MPLPIPFFQPRDESSRIWVESDYLAYRLNARGARVSSIETQQKQRFRHLLILDDLEGRRTIILDAATYSIGRDRTNSIALHSKMVSRQHAILLRMTSPDSSNHLFRLVDGDLQGKRSTNGLMVNGRRLFSHDLKHGDNIIFGGDVKAKYYAVSNVTDSDFDAACDSADWSSFLSHSQNPFETLVPTDDDFQAVSEAALVRLASFPELTPNPILEIDLNGAVTYLNPSAVMQFPEISNAGMKHPILNGLLPMAISDKNTYCNFFVREVELGDRIYEQSVHYIAESDLVRSYISDITERKRAEELLRQQAQREAIINRIVQAMRGTMVTDEVLQITVELLLEALDASHCLIVQISADGSQTHHSLSALAEEAPGLMQANDHFMQVFQADLTQGHQTLISAADSTLDLELLAIAQQVKLQTILLTPLLYLGNDLGSISLFQSQPLPSETHPEEALPPAQREWTEDDLELVKTIADQCAIAIHQAQLYKQVRELNSDLERQVQERTAQLQQKMGELERMNSLKDDFLSTVSHELRTPMSNIKMAIHMLNQFQRDERQQRYIQILEQECRRETELINDLLDLQRLEAGANPAASDKISLNHWLPKVLEPFYSRTHEREQQFKVVDNSSLHHFQSDRVGLERILAELLNNACKYTPQGATIILEVNCNGSPSPRLHLQVTNEAEIPAAELPRVFDKFYRVPNADPWKQGGTGLGLALVKRIVEQLQGTIAAASKGGQTVFTVEIPCYSVTLIP
jgi:signal transduction histidine kinase/pSer/pThr/pTyr-binding forkhead associated (FHA) protein